MSHESQGRRLLPDTQGPKRLCRGKRVSSHLSPLGEQDCLSMNCPAADRKLKPSHSGSVELPHHLEQEKRRHAVSHKGPSRWQGQPTASDLNFWTHATEPPGLPWSPGELPSITNIAIGSEKKKKKMDPLNIQARSGDPGSKE